MLSAFNGHSVVPGILSFLELSLDCSRLIWRHWSHVPKTTCINLTHSRDGVRLCLNIPGLCLFYIHNFLP
jgi:hypothetical protein